MPTGIDTSTLHHAYDTATHADGAVAAPAAPAHEGEEVAAISMPVADHRAVHPTAMTMTTAPPPPPGLHQHQQAPMQHNDGSTMMMQQPAPIQAAQAISVKLPPPSADPVMAVDVNVNNGNGTFDNAIPSEPPAAAAPTMKQRRIVRRSYYNEPSDALPQGIPFHPDDYPELSLDTTTNHAELVHAFVEPLFPKDPSATLAIAYSHRDAAVEERSRARKRKKATLRELQDLRKEFILKKKRLLRNIDSLRASSENVGRWTHKVFELELREPCMWNDKLHNLREYVDRHGKIPEHILKTKGTEDEKALATFISGFRNKVKRGHRAAVRHPHRIKAMEELGVHWESENDARFEVMFAKLLEYRKEHGTFRMPSLDLCKETGDEELILLHNWVFSQVGAFRYQLKSKKVEMVKRFLDVGFSFERWYGTNGHVYERDIPPFDAICKRYVESGGKMSEEDMEVLKRAAEKSPNNKRKGRGKYNTKKKRKKVAVDGCDEGNIVGGETVNEKGENGIGANETRQMEEIVANTPTVPGFTVDVLNEAADAAAVDADILAGAVVTKNAFFANREVARGDSKLEDVNEEEEAVPVTNMDLEESAPTPSEQQDDNPAVANMEGVDDIDATSVSPIPVGGSEAATATNDAAATAPAAEHTAECQADDKSMPAHTEVPTKMEQEEDLNEPVPMEAIDEAAAEPPAEGQASKKSIPAQTEVPMKMDQEEDANAPLPMERIAGDDNAAIETSVDPIPVNLGEPAGAQAEYPVNYDAAAQDSFPLDREQSPVAEVRAVDVSQEIMAPTNVDASQDTAPTDMEEMSIYAGAMINDHVATEDV